MGDLTLTDVFIAAVIALVIFLSIDIYRTGIPVCHDEGDDEDEP